MSKAGEAAREHLKVVPTDFGFINLGVQHYTRHIGLTSLDMRMWADLQVEHAFLEGVKWVIEEAKKLADTCGHEGCEIRYSKPILFKDLEALLKE